MMLGASKLHFLSEVLSTLAVKHADRRIILFLITNTIAAAMLFTDILIILAKSVDRQVIDIDLE